MFARVYTCAHAHARDFKFEFEFELVQFLKFTSRMQCFFNAVLILRACTRVYIHAYIHTYIHTRKVLHQKLRVILRAKLYLAREIRPYARN